MPILDLIIVGTLVWFVVALLRANNLLARNPYLKVKAHEDLAGPFPQGMPFPEKLRPVGWRGISSNTPSRIWVLLVVVIALFAFRLWPSAVFEKDLKLTTSNNAVVPSHASSPDGTPFTGNAYGTFFGDRWGCVEWSGSFENGVPHGVFSVLENCHMGERKFTYVHGKLQNAPNPSINTDAAR